MTVLRNSAHFLECKKKVESCFPDAEITDVEKGVSWKLVSGDTDLSSPHNSHYACYVEALDKCK